jgi:hypothetical protein
MSRTAMATHPHVVILRRPMDIVGQRYITHFPTSTLSAEVQIYPDDPA